MVISKKFLFITINMFRLRQRAIANITIIDYPFQDVEEREYNPTVIALANQYLLRSFSLLESGLLVPDQDKSPFRIEVGLDIAAETEKILKLSSDRKPLELNLFYTTFACQGKLIVKEDYSLAIPGTEMGPIVYRIEKFSDILKANVSLSKNHSQVS